MVVVVPLLATAVGMTWVPLKDNTIVFVSATLPPTSVTPILNPNGDTLGRPVVNPAAPAGGTARKSNSVGASIPLDAFKRSTEPIYCSAPFHSAPMLKSVCVRRSEERRVGKECRSG